MTPKRCSIAAKLILWPGRPREAKAVWSISHSIVNQWDAGQFLQEGTVKDGRRPRLCPAHPAAPGGQGSIMAISSKAMSSHYCSCGLGDTKCGFAFLSFMQTHAVRSGGNSGAEQW